MAGPGGGALLSWCDHRWEVARPTTRESTWDGLTSRFSVDCRMTTGTRTGASVSTLVTAVVAGVAVEAEVGAEAGAAAGATRVATTARGARSGASPPRRSRCCKAPRAIFARPSGEMGLDTAVWMLSARVAVTRDRYSSEKRKRLQKATGTSGRAAGALSQSCAAEWRMARSCGSGERYPLTLTRAFKLWA